MFEKIEGLCEKARGLSFDDKKKLIASLDEMMASGSLPDDYRNFLLHFGASINFKYNVVFKGVNPSPWANDNLYDDLESLYGLKEFMGEYTIFEAIETYKDDFKSQWIPIGSSSGGNQICLSVCGKMFGQVWFWDHEVDPKFDLENVYFGMTFSASNFTDFIDRLEIDKEEPDVSGVVKVNLDF